MSCNKGIDLKAHAVRLFFAAQCLVYTTDLHAEPSSLTLVTSLQYYDSREYADSGDRLNREAGWLGGLGARWQKALSPRLTVALGGEYAPGHVDYDGQTQSGTPFDSTTDIRVFRLGGDASVCLLACRALFRGGLTWYARDRNIQGHGGVSGLYEEYRWHEWTLGADWYLDSGRYITLGAEWLYVADAQMMIDLSDFGGGEPVVSLPDSSGHRIKLAYRFPGRPISLSLVHEWLAIEASDAIRVRLDSGPALVNEPESRAEHWTFSLHWHL